MSDYRPTVIDRALVQWHEDWKDVMNDAENRRFFAGRACTYLNMSDSRWNVRIGDRGTIREDFEGDSVHFMAFHVLPNLRMIVFDPAGPGSAFVDPTLPRRIQAKVPSFDVFMDPRSPQRSPNDNFCQTWSLAWLIGGDYEVMINNCVQRQDVAQSVVDRDIIEFDVLSDIAKMLVLLGNPPNMGEQWQAIKHNFIRVMTNFDKFRITRPSYRADLTRRRLDF